MIFAQAVSASGTILTAGQVTATLQAGLSGRFTGQSVLVLIPDHTRSAPLPFLFRTLVEVLAQARRLDFMVALGTHPPLSEAQLNRLVGITAEERRGRYAHVGLLNHAWDDPASLARLGTFEPDQVRELAGQAWHPSLPERVEIRINRAALEHDAILIVGPTFPHEVAGFSGGAKYLFPGISGPELIHATHWLGALSGVVGTIGIADTPVRAMIHAAADRLPTPVTLAALIMQGETLESLIVGDVRAAWRAAAELSAVRHVRRYAAPFRRVLSCPAPMYDELWTAAKAMYKLEPVVAQGGEVILYAPQLDTVSRVHGKTIYAIGYHTLPYFLEQWDRFRGFPLGVLAHSTHLRGAGRMENGVEIPNVRLVLSSRIPPEDCARLNLGYLDPGKLRIEEFQEREAEGTLYVPHAGEVLYRVGGGG